MSADPRPDIRRWRFTVDQYEQMGRTGVFSDDDRVELLDGEVVSMSPIGPTHASVCDRLTRLLIRQLDDRAIVRVQNPIRLPPWSEPQPDLAVLDPRDDFYATRHPEPDQIPLAIEVCHSSLPFDRGVKVPIYARAELPQVWLVDVERRVLHVHRDPADGAYADITTLHPGATVQTGAPLDLELYVSSILG